MSIHAVAETPLATTDAQVIAGMAADVLASLARLHADGLAAVTTLATASRPVRVDLPPAAAPVVVVPEPAAESVQSAESAEESAELVDEPEQVEPVEAELVEAELVEAELVEEPAEDDVPVVRIAEAVRIAPLPRGRHMAEAVTDQLPAQQAA